MPPVHVIPEIWVIDDNVICGCATPLQINDNTRIGVEVPIPTALCHDIRLVRQILVHEFAHCFAMLVRIIDHADAGRSDALALPRRTSLDDEQAEEALLVDPHQWFGDEDARHFLRSHGTGLEAIDQTIIRLNMLGRVPTVSQPTGEFTARNVIIPQAVADHVHQLRQP